MQSQLLLVAAVCHSAVTVVVGGCCMSQCSHSRCWWLLYVTVQSQLLLVAAVDPSAVTAAVGG